MPFRSRKIVAIPVWRDYAPWFFLRYWRYINHLLTYLHYTFPFQSKSHGTHGTRENFRELPVFSFRRIMCFHKRRLSRRHSTGLLSSHHPSTFYASACSQCITRVNKDRQNDWLIGRPTKHDHLSRTAFNVNYIASSESKVDISKPKHNRRICRRHWYYTSRYALSFLSDASSFWATITSNGSPYATAMMSCLSIVSDIAVFVLKRDVKLQPTNPVLPVSL